MTVLEVITLEGFTDVLNIAGLKYNAEKEEKAKQDQKKRQLEAVELAKHLEEAKKKAGNLDSKHCHTVCINFFTSKLNKYILPTFYRVQCTSEVVIILVV